MNTVNLVGRLTRDVVVRQTKQTGKNVASFSLAVLKRLLRDRFRVEIKRISLIVLHGIRLQKHYPCIPKRAI